MSRYFELGHARFDDFATVNGQEAELVIFYAGNAIKEYGWKDLCIRGGNDFAIGVE